MYPVCSQSNYYTMDINGKIVPRDKIIDSPNTNIRRMKSQPNIKRPKCPEKMPKCPEWIEGVATFFGKHHVK